MEPFYLLLPFIFALLSSCFYLLFAFYLLLPFYLQEKKFTYGSEAEEGFTLTLDTFLHVQQLRKKRLRAFCSRSGKVTRMPRSREEKAYLLSSLRVSTKLDLLYCQVPSTGMEEWQQLLEKLEEEENVTLPAPLPYPWRHGPKTQLSQFNLTEIEAMLGSYTKVLFVRDPFQRLISMFMQGLGTNPSFSSFVQDVLDSGQKKAGAAWKPLVSLCRPCLVQYDYVVVFGFLRQELAHLLRRAGLPADSLLSKFTDTQVQWTYSWLSEQMFSELSLQQKQQLSHFYRGDLAAFPFPSSFLSDLLSTPETW
uniref:Carbohydrate sulfotransferase n=1 Tax=Falco tinnunculus TaxID=100819 RepID=A0A8C4VCM1_FALTI